MGPALLHAELIEIMAAYRGHRGDEALAGAPHPVASWIDEHLDDVLACLDVQIVAHAGAKREESDELDALAGPDDVDKLSPVREGCVAWWDPDDEVWREVDHGEWYVRIDGDDNGELIDPWPLYARRSDAAARGVSL